MIKELHLRNIGPAPIIDISFANRLNLITGDNGLGKSFLLDVAWWALTGIWTGNAATPSFDDKKSIKATKTSAEINWLLSGKGGPLEPFRSVYDFANENWKRPPGRKPMPGLVIYLRIDGSFSVWDPARNYWKTAISRGIDQPNRPPAYLFNRDQVWEGLTLGSEVICNGLLRDWMNWQREPEQSDTSRFNLLRRVLKDLSPLEMPNGISPGKYPTRIPERGVLDIPTIELPYGTIPVTQASAGMQRIMALAYLLVWAWSEHIEKSEMQHQDPAERLVLLVDEVEAHLHPKWQLAILPAILNLFAELQPKISTRDKKSQLPVQTQILACTHSPLVLASIEPQFDVEQDSLFSFETSGEKVWVEPKPWAKQGDVNNWLESDMFDLKGGGRSNESNQAIAAADAFMRNDDMSHFPENLRSKNGIHTALKNLLPGNDPYWPLWIVDQFVGNK